MPKKQKKIKPGYVTYKGIEFKVRPDVLGISEKIQTMITEYNFGQYQKSLPYLEMPQYEEILTIESNCAEILKDMIDTGLKIKNKQIPKADGDKLIKQQETSLKKEYDKLNSPRLAELYMNIKGDKKIYELSYKQNPAHIKALAEIYLEGDITKIDFENKDKDYFDLSKQLWDNFFLTRQLVRLPSMQL